MRDERVTAEEPNIRDEKHCEPDNERARGEAHGRGDNMRDVAVSLGAVYLRAQRWRDEAPVSVRCLRAAVRGSLERPAWT